MATDATFLSFEGKGLKLNSEADAAVVVRAIEACPGITAIKLSGNTIGIGAAKEIAAALARANSATPTLVRADLSDIFTGRLLSEIPEALTAFADALKNIPTLTELNVSDNAFGPVGAEALAPLIRANRSIKVLRFNNNGLGIGGGKILAQALSDAHAAGDFRPTTFVAGRNRLENEGAKALSAAFGKIRTFVEIVMPQNGINHAGIAALAEAFKENKDLEVIDLNDNTFTVKGAEAMAVALPALQKLRKINFGDCLIRPAGARAIAKAIASTHPALEEVDFTYGELNDAAIVAVADALQSKLHIRSLQLNGNKIRDDGMKAIKRNGLEKALGSLSDNEEDSDESDESSESESSSSGGSSGSESDSESSDSSSDSDASETEAKRPAPKQSPGAKENAMSAANTPGDLDARVGALSM